MRNARRRLILWLAGFSLIAVVAVAVFSRQQIAERWYIYRLGSEAQATVDHAATQLVAMGSTRAIMPLIEQIPREASRGRAILSLEKFYVFFESGAWNDATPPDYWTDSAVLKALHDLGDPAREPVERELKKNREEFRLLRAIRAGNSLRYSKYPPPLRGMIYD